MLIKSIAYPYDTLNQGKYEETAMKLEDISHKSAFQTVILAYCKSKIGDNKSAKMILPKEISEIQFDTIEEFIASQIMRIEILSHSGEYIDFQNIEKNIKQSISQISDEKYQTYLKYKFDVLKAEYLISKSYPKRAKKILLELEQNLKDVDCPIIKSLVIYHLGGVYKEIGDFKKAINYFNKSLKISINLENKNTYVFTLNKLGIIYAMKNLLEKAKEYFSEILEIKSFENSLIRAKVYNNFGIISQMQGDLDQSSKYFSKSIEIAEEINSQIEMVNGYINIGHNKQQESNYAEALRWYRRAQTTNLHLNNNQEQARILLSIGVVHKKMGHFHQAEYHYEKALVIARRVDDKTLISEILNNLASIHNNQGKVKMAIEEFDEVLTLSKAENNQVILSYALTNLGLAYTKLDQYDKAVESLKKAYEIKKRLGNLINISSTLFHLIQIEISNNHQESARKYLKEFEQIAKRTNNIEVVSRYNIAKANLLQLSDDLSDQVNASKLIEEVLSGEYVNFEINVFAMISFCEYLLIELRSTNSREIFDTLEHTVEKLYELASDNESHELITKTLIIQAKLALLTFDTKDAINYLKQAQNIAETHNLEEVLLKISYIENQVQSMLYNITDDLYDSLDSKEEMERRIDELEIIDYVKNLHYQKQTYEILKSDLANIRRFNTDLANIVQFNEKVPLSLENLARIVDLTSREINVTYRSLLIINKVENNEFKPHIEYVNIGIVIEDMIDIYQPGFNQKKLKTTINSIPKDLFVNVDIELFEIILDHILLNCIKFTKKNGELRMFIKQLEDNGVELVFQNDSETIPQETLMKLPEKYFQYSPRKRLVKGYGIGLTLVKQAMQIMDKTMEINSPISGKDQGFEITIQF